MSSARQPPPRMTQYAEPFAGRAEPSAEPFRFRGKPSISLKLTRSTGLAEPLKLLGFSPMTACQSACVQGVSASQNGFAIVTSWSKPPDSTTRFERTRG